MRIILSFLVAVWPLVNVFSQETRQLAVDKPLAVADLKTNGGAALVQAQWYVQAANLRDADFRLPGASASDMLMLYPTGAKIKTHTIHPQINAPDFDKAFKKISDLK